MSNNTIMQYRQFGKLDFKASALGFGFMRLPTIGQDEGRINEPVAINMLRYAIEDGVNYVDSAYIYHNGNSEPVLGKALQDGYRQKVKVATKLPTWLVNHPADFDRALNEQLRRLQTDHIDFYLLHNLITPFWARACHFGALRWLDKIKADGRVGHVGFSFHDDFALFKQIVDAYDGWAMCQIQYNYVNENVQAGTAGLEYAARKGLAVVVMEPMLGGCLASVPGSVQRIFSGAATQRTPAEWALQWLWHKPEVSVVLSGMSAMSQVIENVASACRSGVGSLTPDDLSVIARVRQEFELLQIVPCTRCGYCMPCPTGVDIPRNMQLYTDARRFQGYQLTLNRNLYGGLPGQARAGFCVACRKCEEKCPQKIPISEWMPKIHQWFGV